MATPTSPAGDTPGNSAPDGPKPRPEPGWYVHVAGRTWGPYTDVRLAGFIEEGRVKAKSLLGAHAAGPFEPAGDRPELRTLFAPALNAGPTPKASGTLAEGEQMVAPEPVTGAQTAEAAALAGGAVQPDPAVLEGGAGRPEEAAAAAGPAVQTLVVWADLASVSAARFETLLGRYGRFAGIRPGLWLVRTKAGAPAVRNGLSRAFGGEDALLVVEAPLDRAAWFNLDAAAEINLRELWGGSNDS